MTHLTSHHILPKRWFGRNDLIFRCCRDCHTEIEAQIIDAEISNKGKQLPEMQYIKILVRYVLDKANDNNPLAVELDNIIVGIFQAVRIYFNITLR